ncbi:NYN domain-containing protein (plasmid) [Alicyclobacillus sp. SO9]|nr:NYN domain-containing protein [Alicyclobacillus sp. SO9]
MSSFFENFFGTAKKSFEDQKRDNVAIYVDYDNVYWTLMNSYGHDPDDSELTKNLFAQLWEFYGQDHIRTFRSYADYEKVKTSLTSLQRKRVQIRHVYSNDKSGDYRKNASDIEMSIDVIESTYKDSNISCYVIVTADSDMIPVLSRLMYKGKRVELFYLSSAAPKHIDMTRFAHHSVDLLEFLNVEIQQYDVEKYAFDSLMFIEEWHQQFGHKTDRWLGTSWLKVRFQEKFSIPSDVASEVIEYLQSTGSISTENRPTDKGSKPSISITENGRKIITELREVAPTDLT